MADEGFGYGGGGGELAACEVGFLFAHDGEGHDSTGIEVLDLYGVEHLHFLGAHLGGVHHLGVCYCVLKICDFEFKKALSLTCGFVFCIF